jgi:hypothetical protein
MKTRDYAIGGIIVLVIGFILLRAQTPDNSPKIENDVPINSEETENRLEEVLGRTLPDDAERAALSDFSGNNFSAIATRSESSGTVEFTILADLENKEGAVYQVWTGESIDGLRSLGTLTAAKGGYLFEYMDESKLSNFNNVVISLEEKVDEAMETRILQGSF